MNKLLQCQLREHCGGADKVPGNINALLNAISATYDRFEKEYKRIEDSMELSSKEIIELKNQDKKSGKDELEEANRQLKTLFENIEEIVYSVDMVTLKILQISPVCEKVYGYTPAEFLEDGDLWHKVILPDDIHIVDQHIKALYEGKQVVCQYRILRRDKNIRWLESKIIPSLDAAGQLIRMDGVTIDISERKQAKKELEESVSMLEATIESTADGILVADFNGKMVRFNKKFAELSRIPREILDTQNDEKAMSFVLDQLANPAEFLAKVKELYTHKEAVSFDIIKFKDDRVFERYSQPQLIKGKCVGRVWSFRDITERKLAEDKLLITSAELKHALKAINKIMDSSLDVICAVDAEGYFIQVSAACETVWGYTADELIGKLLIDFVYPEDREKTQKAASNVIAGHNMINFENRYIRKDGSLVPINWSASWDPIERIRYGVARDATEKKRAEKAFEIERERFNEMFLQAPSSMGMLKGPDHVYEMANPLYLQLIGKTDIIGKSVKEILPEIEEQGFIEILDEVYKTGKSFSANEMLVKLHKNETGELVEIYLNFIYQAYTNSDGNIEGIFFFAIDVTEQVLSRKKIEESELRYRSLIEQATDAICIADVSLKFIDINPYACKVLGYTQEEALQLFVTDIIFIEDLKTNPFKFKEVKSEEIIRNERRLRKKDGTAVVMEVSTKLMEDGRFILFGHDITERKISEEALRESEKRLRQIIDLVPHFIFAKDGEGKFVLANEAVARAYGSAVEDLIGKSDADFNSQKEEVEHFLQEDLKVINSGNVKYNIEETITDAAGNVLTLSTTKIPYTSPGLDAPGVLGVSVDITEHKKAEAVLKESEGQLSIATQIAKLGYWEYDVPKNLFKFNDQFYSILKTTAEEAGGYTMSSEQYAALFVYPDDIPMLVNETVKAVKSPDPHYTRQIEHRIKYPDAEIGYMTFRFFTVKNEPGRTIKIFGAIQDITERKKAEETLLRSEADLEIKNKQLELKNKELEQFAYVASHDMQEPLRTTSSFVELLQKQYKGKLDEKADKYLTFITQSSDRMKVLIKDLLDYSRIGRKKELALVDGNIMLNEVLADLGQAIHEANAVIIADHLPVISGYPTEIKQLFQNLVANAIKFRRQHVTPAIHICVQKKGGYWEFAFKDNGIGIDEQHRERIFIIFQRLHTRNEYEGSGIGLAHCKKIVELHGGKIWIESIPGEGSSFHFTIPV